MEIAGVARVTEGQSTEQAEPALAGHFSVARLREWLYLYKLVVQVSLRQLTIRIDRIDHGAHHRGIEVTLRFGAIGRLQARNKLHEQSEASSVMRGPRALLVWLCLTLFVAVGIAEPAHFHSTAGSSRQHCSLCIASHSVARPAPFVRTVVAPALCVALLAVSGAILPDFQAVLSFYIRPPPSL